MTKKLLILAVLLLVSAPAFAQSVDTAWVKTYNGPGNSSDHAYAVAIDDSGNVYVTGHSIGSGTERDYATIKYYPNGDTAWVRRYNGPANGFDGANAMAVDDSGNVYVTGLSLGSGSEIDYATIKYRPNGDTAWLRRYNGPGNYGDWSFAITLDSSGNVYVTGYSWGSGTGHDYATIKYYPNGDTAWVRRYNGPENGHDDAYAIAVDDSNSIYVTGTVTVKYDADGNRLWIAPSGTVAIALDDSGNVYVCGTSGTIKYSANGNQL